MASHQSPPKKPRLSLQIKTAVGPSVRASRGFPIDPKDPTTFNTLSNAYVTAIERSTPLTAINTLQSFSISTPCDYQDSKQRVATPYIAHYPDTPLSSHADSPLQPMEVTFPSAMTATPPLSAGPMDGSSSRAFSFCAADTAPKTGPMPAAFSPIEARTIRPRAAPLKISGLGIQAPYQHPRSLHSILRNSPLPPQTAIHPQSPRRQSLRLREKAEKRVEYNSPLTQDITTNKYIKSHIDLLVEEASPNSPPITSMFNQPDDTVDIAKAFTANEIQDGGMTPGPDGELGGRSAVLSPATPSGIRKRKRREKKRRWVWTIGQEDEENVEGEEVGGAIAALQLEARRASRGAQVTTSVKLEDEAMTPMATIPNIKYIAPTPSVESLDSATADSASESTDTEMTDASSVFSLDEAFDTRDWRERQQSLGARSIELDAKTPTATTVNWQLGAGLQQQHQLLAAKRDSPIPELALGRDTPVPSELMAPSRDTPVPSELLIPSRDTPVPPEMV